jgi:hypothetical protein
VHLKNSFYSGCRLYSTLALGLCSVLAANAATILVTNTADAGPGSLREALEHASTSIPTRVEVATAGTIFLASPLPMITGDVTIAATGGVALRVSGEAAVPLLSVAANGALTAQNLTLVNGLASDGGGALRNLGTTLLRQCVLSNNVGTNLGGAILNYGTLTLDACTLVSNRVYGLPGRSLVSTNTAETGFNAQGGAICSQEGRLHLTNCTVWGNMAIGGPGGDNGIGAGGPGGAALGGGLFWTASDLSSNILVNCTVSANGVFGGEGGLSGSIFGPPGSAGWGTGGGILILSNTVGLFLLNTILAGNAADHALPEGYSPTPIQSLGGNLIGITNGLSGFRASDLLGADPQLGMLQSNGGPVPTCALPLDSLAIDHGVAFSAPRLDARGVIRPQGEGVDIGAYEVGNQRIVFPDPGAALMYGDAPLLLEATASSELPVSFTVVVGPGVISSTNTSAVHFTGAGLVWVVASQPGSDIYLPAGNVTNVLWVKPAPLEAVAADASRFYGATNPTFAGTLSGVVNNDPITVRFESAATVTTAAGTYGPETALAITPVLLDPAGRLTNYTIATTNGTLTIQRAEHPLVAIGSNTSRAYGTANPPLQGTIQGVLNADAISATWITPALPSSPVGEYPITPVWSDPEGRLSNYNLVTNAGTLSVMPVPLTVTAVNASRPYGEANPTFSGTLAGLVNADPITALFRSAAGRNTPPGYYDANSPYAIQPIFIDPAGRLRNYTVVTNSGALTITKATQPLTVVALSTNRVYGTTNLSWPVAIEGILNGDPISAVWVSHTTPGSPIGTYPMVPEWNDPAGLLAGYNIVTNAGTLAINPASLTAIAGNASRDYGTTNPAFSGTLTGVMNNDVITAQFESAATPTTAPGAYGPGSPFAIKPRLIDPDNRAGNYSVTLSEGTLTILDMPTVWILQPTNGSIYITGMDVPAVAEARDNRSPIKSLVFNFSTNQLAGSTTNGLEFSATFTNIGLGTYSVQAAMTNAADVGFLSEPVSFAVVDISGTPSVVDTNSLEVRQTGLYHQDLWITNIASLPIPAVTVDITGLRPDVKVYNAVWTTNGTSLVRYDYPTPPGEVLRLRIEYYVPDGVPPTASFRVNLAKPAAPIILPGLGTPVAIEFFGYPWGAGASLLEFRTVTDSTYYIQYSSNLTNWTTIQPAIAGNSNWIQWLDNGPPKTKSLPMLDASGQRYYRVLRFP